MDEKKEEKVNEDPEKDKPKEPTPDPDVGKKSEAESLIEQSNKSAERNEKVLEGLRKENDRTEKLAIQNQLAGKGQAGQPAPASKTQEELDDEEAEKRVAAFE